MIIKPRVLTLAAALVAGCTAPAGSGAAPATRPDASTLALHVDYAGAEALMTALERDSLPDPAVDSLLAVGGVRAMVDNVIRYFPEVSDAHFRESIRALVQTRRRPVHNEYFEFREAWQGRERIRTLLTTIRQREGEIVDRALAQIGPYAPATGPLAINAFFIAGGVSDGFVFDDPRAPAFYANVVRADGDFDGVIANVAHEAYHVMQKAAQRRVPGLAVFADSTARVPPVERLLVVTLAEGTANYVVDPTRSPGSGAGMQASRERYQRNLAPARIRENFALFDTVVAQLAAGAVTWENAYGRGFSGNNDARFYFVGYVMARALEQHCGRACIGAAFGEHPGEFFRRYVALYRAHPEIPGRFSPATEALIARFR